MIRHVRVLRDGPIHNACGHTIGIAEVLAKLEEVECWKLWRMLPPV
jgi:hypothetical protein